MKKTVQDSLEMNLVELTCPVVGGLLLIEAATRVWGYTSTTHPSRAVVPSQEGQMVRTWATGQA